MSVFLNASYAFSSPKHSERYLKKLKRLKKLKKLYKVKLEKLDELELDELERHALKMLDFTVTPSLILN